MNTIDESTINGGPFALPMDVVDAIDERANKAMGIVHVIGRAAGREDSPNAIANACWAVESLLEEIKALAMTKAQKPEVR